MSQQLLDLIVAIGPTLLWVCLIAFVLWRLRDPIRTELLPRIGSIGVFGVSVTFTQHAVHDGLAKPHVSVPPGMNERITRRLKVSSELVREASILWLDDHPVHNVVERRFLTRLGASIETVTSTTEAIEALRWSEFDIVISNIKRAAEAPTPLITEAAAADLQRATVIYYINNPDPSLGTPRGAFGITNRIEDLYMLVLDALEERHASARRPT